MVLINSALQVQYDLKVVITKLVRPYVIFLQER